MDEKSEYIKALLIIKKYCDKRQVEIKQKIKIYHNLPKPLTAHLYGQNKAFGLTKQKINNLIRKANG